MSKEKQTDSSEENNEPLLSIVTTNVIQPTPVVNPEPSAFNQVLENKPKAPEVVAPQPVVKTPVKPAKKTVYEFTYINEVGEEFTIFSYQAPQYVAATTLQVTKFFGKEILYENVLGLSEVNSMCKVEFEEEDVLIDLNKGVVIKSLEEESWMSLDYDATKKIFDEAVLKAYRSASAIQTNPLQPKRKPAQAIQQQTGGQDQALYREGNIPVNRGPLVDF